MVATIPHWIDGARVDGVGDRTAPVHDPSTGERTGTVRLAATADVDAAVDAASRAFESWRDVPLGARTDVLFRFRELVDRHRHDLARLIVAEHGKVLSDALGEVQRGLEVVEHVCGVAELLKGEVTPDVATGVDAHSVRRPLGVVAGITPFNFPVMVPMWMYPVAIACGNTFVLKPSEQDPSPSLLAAELFSQAGLPDGVLGVVQGDAEAVDALLSHPSVRAVSFVGSTPVARHVHRTASEHGKRTQALGGAKNHMVVLPDADLDAAADAAVGAAYGSAGERCMAVSVVVAVGDAADHLVPAIADRARRLDIGPGLRSDDDPTTGPDMGPLVSAAHRDRVAGYVGLGVDEGARLVVDGRDLAIDGHPDGYWLGPSLFDHVTPDMKIYEDEIFGPVLCVVRVVGFDEAVSVVNANPYGNGAAIFTRDGGAARAFQRDVTAGMVGVNVAIPVPVAAHSFGGWKDSLFGSTHVYGPEGVRFFTRYQAVTTRWSAPPSGPGRVDLDFPTR